MKEMNKANRDKVNEVKKELLQMYPQFSGFVNHTLVATMCFEYYQSKLKNNVDLAGVSVSQLISERMTWLLDYVWCCDANDLTDKEAEELEKRLAEEKAVIEWLYSR